MESQSKRPRISGGSGGGGSLWEGLSPEILGLIFTRIVPADELIRVVPFVCKAWNEVVSGPYCWTDIDVEQWCRRCFDIDRIDSAVRKLVRKSNGTLRQLSVFMISNATFAFVANCERSLKVLQIPMSDVTDRMLMKHAESLKMLTTLDISNCNKITCKGLETLGNCCTSLVNLKRNMQPQQLVSDIGSVAKKEDEEALVIADTMRSLHSLELGYGCMTDVGLDAILTKCENLINLDILGCYGVKLEGDLEDRCNQLMSFRSAWEEEYQDDDDDDDDGDDESSEEGNEYFSESSSDSDGV